MKTTFKDLKIIVSQSILFLVGEFLFTNLSQHGDSDVLIYMVVIFRWRQDIMFERQSAY